VDNPSIRSQRGVGYLLLVDEQGRPDA